MLAKKTQKMKFNREKYKVLKLDYKIKFFSAGLGEEEGTSPAHVGRDRAARRTRGGLIHVTHTPGAFTALADVHGKL